MPIIRFFFKGNFGRFCQPPLRGFGFLPCLSFEESSQFLKDTRVFSYKLSHPGEGFFICRLSSLGSLIFWSVFGLSGYAGLSSDRGNPLTLKAHRFHIKSIFVPHGGHQLKRLFRDGKTSWPNTSSSWARWLYTVLFLVHTLDGAFSPRIPLMIKLVLWEMNNGNKNSGEFLSFLFMREWYL